MLHLSTSAPRDTKFENLIQTPSPRKAPLESGSLLAPHPVHHAHKRTGKTDLKMPHSNLSAMHISPKGSNVRRKLPAPPGRSQVTSLPTLQQLTSWSSTSTSPRGKTTPPAETTRVDEPDARRGAVHGRGAPGQRSPGRAGRPQGRCPGLGTALRSVTAAERLRERGDAAPQGRPELPEPDHGRRRGARGTGPPRPARTAGRSGVLTRASLYFTGGRLG